MKSRPGKIPEYVRGVGKRGKNENISARPSGLCDKVERAISGRGPESAGKMEEVYHCSRVEEEVCRCTELPLWQSDGDYKLIQR